MIRKQVLRVAKPVRSDELHLGLEASPNFISSSHDPSAIVSYADHRSADYASNLEGEPMGVRYEDRFRWGEMTPSHDRHGGHGRKLEARPNVSRGFPIMPGFRGTPVRLLCVPVSLFPH